MKLRNIRMMDQETYDALTQTENDTLYFVDMPFDAYIINSWHEGAAGYNIYSNGYVEQWGKYQRINDNQCLIPLMVEMKDAYYNIQLSISCKDGYNANAIVNAPYTMVKTNNTFTVGCGTGVNTNWIYYEWVVRGYKK